MQIFTYQNLPMIKQLFTGALAAFTIATPVQARIEAGSAALFETLQQVGVNIDVNPESCGTGFDGYYNSDKRYMILCIADVPTANDGNTLRHESWHHLQACAARKRGKSGIRPVLEDDTELKAFVAKVLPQAQIDRIVNSYGAKSVPNELEAFASAQYFSSTEITQLLKHWCN